jgi:hypothetical protein
MATNPNIAAAYSLYVEGKSLAEIARITGEPYEVLQKRAQREDWAVLATKLRDGLPACAPDDPNRSLPAVQADKAKWHLERVQANRERNIAVIQKLQDDLLHTVNKLASGELKLRRYWCSKGIISHVDADPGLQDRVALATYAQTVMNLSYQALGDKAILGDKATQEMGPGAAQSVPQITVVLPGIIQQPREERNVTPAAGQKTIDVETTVEKPQ